MSWQRIQGHDAQRRAFAHAVERGRLAHAYLMTGPPGVGKKLFVEELSKALLCESPGSGLAACEQCDSCILVAAGNHPDLFNAARLEEKNEVTIAVMRELCQRFSLKPARGRSKIGILDDADDLNEEASNCFLKTLEEPPPRSVLFLIGTTPERQLSTIVSRCQVVRFAPLSDEVVTAILRQHDIQDAKLLERLVRLGHGSPGQALELADPGLWEFRKELLHGLLLPRPDSVGLGKSLWSFVEKAGKETVKQRRRASQVLRLLIEFFDDCLAVRLGAAPRLGDSEELAMLRKMADRIDPDQLLHILERCLDADSQLGRNVKIELVVEAVLDAVGARISATDGMRIKQSL